MDALPIAMFVAALFMVAAIPGLLMDQYGRGEWARRGAKIADWAGMAAFALVFTCLLALSIAVLLDAIE